MPPGRTKEVSGESSALRVSIVAFKPLDLARQHPQALRLALALGHGEVGAEIEQIVLDAPQHRIQFGRIGQMHPHNADRGVGLVHGAIGGNAQIIFRTAFAAAERGGAVIAGPRVDPIKHDHCLFL